VRGEDVIEREHFSSPRHNRACDDLVPAGARALDETCDRRRCSLRARLFARATNSSASERAFSAR